METNELILSTLRTLAENQGSIEEDINGKPMCRVAAQDGVCIYGLLDDNIDQEDVEEEVRAANFFAQIDIVTRAINQLKRQGHVHFEGSPRRLLWVVMK